MLNMEDNNIKQNMDELVNLYNELDNNNKRNELNLLIAKTNDIINELLKLENNENTFKVKNYDTNIHKNLNESEILSFIYEDIYCLKNNLLLLLTATINNKTNDI